MSEYVKTFTFDLGPEPRPLVITRPAEINGEFDILKSRYVDGELESETFSPGPFIG